AITPGAAQVGRIEHHQLERSTLEGLVAKIHEHIRLHVQGPVILTDVLLIADIVEQGVLVVVVETEHGAATAGVENFSGLVISDARHG
ncbi:hypothetical protein, partial [Pseudomonas helleri]